MRELIPVKRNWRYIGCYIVSAYIGVNVWTAVVFYFDIFVCLFDATFFFFPL